MENCRVSETNPQSPIPNPSPSDQLGLDEIKRRVGAAIEKVIATCGEGPCSSSRTWTMRELTVMVAREMDKSLADAIFRQGLVRLVRRMMRMRNRRRNKVKQAKGAKSQ
jgi:hypothetical protein